MSITANNCANGCSNGACISVTTTTSTTVPNGWVYGTIASPYNGIAGAVRVSANSPGSPYTYKDASNNYNLANVAPGTWTITASNLTCCNDFTLSVGVTSGAGTSLNIAMNTKAILMVNVRDTSGNPISGADVWVSNPPSYADNGWAAKSGTNGGTSIDYVDQGTRTVSASKAGYVTSSQSVSVPAGSTSPIFVNVNFVLSTTTTTTTVLPYFSNEASVSPIMPSSSSILPSYMAIGDADNDGTKEVVYAFNQLIVYRDTGSSLVQEAMYDIPDSARPSPLIDDVDGDGQNEIVFVVVYLVSGSQYNTRLYVARHTGSSIVIEATYETGSPANNPILPTIDDLDGDGAKEIIFYNSANSVAVLRHTGSSLQVEATYSAGFIDELTIPAYDLDSDGSKEIVFASIDPINILRHTGSSIVLEATYKPTTNYMPSLSPAIGNLDGDSGIETFLNDANSYGYFTIRHTGSSIVQESVYSPSNAAPTSAVAADFDNDGSVEVVVSGVGTGTTYDKIKVFRHTGSSLVQEAEISVSNRDYNAVAADIDNDGTIEIIRASMDGYLYSMRHTGSSLVIEGSYYLGSPLIFSPVIDDIDGDGRVEIVTATSSGIRVVQAGVKGSTTYSSWPVFMRNSARTGYQPK